MKIRSITNFINPGWPLMAPVINTAATFMGEARHAFQDAGFEVQTTRLATSPFPTILPNCHTEMVVEFAHALESEASANGFDYLSIGPALPGNLESYHAIPAVIASTEITFASAVIASRDIGVSLPSVRACADIIRTLASVEPNGFANLFFTALGNVPPGGPFFPAAYHDGSSPSFAIATEAADLAVTAFSDARTLQEARTNLTLAVEEEARRILAVADKLSTQFDDRFGGIDFSLAPFPKINSSLGTAMETLGGMKVGRHGSLAVSAIIADTIDKAIFPHCGFSGMMLPLLEDAILADRAAQGTLTVKDLLLYSTVCGTGLDTVPLPGDVTNEALTALLVDLAVLSLRLDKPLTARLMPIPGKHAGDLTEFNFPYFANSRVMEIEADDIVGVMKGEEVFQINTHLR